MAACCRAPQSRTRCVPTSVNERALELSMASCNGFTSSSCMLTPCESTGAMQSGSMSGQDCNECMRMHTVPACAEPGMAGAGHVSPHCRHRKTVVEMPAGLTGAVPLCGWRRVAGAGRVHRVCRARAAAGVCIPAGAGSKLLGTKMRQSAAGCPEQQFCDAVVLSHAE